jgi:hypothetical protein
VANVDIWPRSSNCSVCRRWRCRRSPLLPLIEPRVAEHAFDRPVFAESTVLGRANVEQTD